MTKKIIFFDGDGTLWYPRQTKRTQKPFWVYLDAHTKDSYLDHLVLTPHAVETLRVLRSHTSMTVLLSTHPHEATEAATVLDEKVRHFGLDSLFDEVYATAEYPEAKGEKMLEILQRHNLKTEDALMVGDSYRWDYTPAEAMGVDAVLINSDYHQEKKDQEPVDYLINDLDELPTLLGI